MNEWAVAITETEIFGEIDKTPKVSIVTFENENKAKDFLRKSFCTECSKVVGLCYAKFDDKTITAKVCGECTVVTLGMRRPRIPLHNNEVQNDK